MSRPPVPSSLLVPGGVLGGLVVTVSALLLAPHLSARAPHRLDAAVVKPASVSVPTSVSPALEAVALDRRSVQRAASRGAARTVLVPAVRIPGLTATGPSFSGYASWYGTGLQGQPTASGEAYDGAQLTAASRTLPFGTRLQVCHSDRCVVVRINDRGPFIWSRVLDLSQAAMDQLGGFGVGWVSAVPVTTTPVTTTALPRRRPAAPRRPHPPLPVRPAVPALPRPVSAAPVGAGGSHQVLLASGLQLLTGSGLARLRRARS